MLRTSLKKAVALGLLSALTLGGGIAQAQRNDDDDDDDDDDEAPELVFRGGDCENNGNVGINLGLCNLAVPLSVLNILGSNEQTALGGVSAVEDEDGDDDGDGDDGDGGSCENNGNVGINLGLCALAAPISVLNILGSNEQAALAGGGDCENNGNVGINLGLCRISLPISVLNLLGENEQFAATP